MYHILHLDEKWFYLKKVEERFYAAEDEEIPAQTTRHISHIEKVMFLSVVGRPHFFDTLVEPGEEVEGPQQQYFDGKIGIWPVGEMGVAQRTSVNRPAGAPVWSNKEMDRPFYRRMIIDLVLPAIKEKYPCHTQDVI